MAYWRFLCLLTLLAAARTALAVPDPASVEPNVFRILTYSGSGTSVGTGFWITGANVLVTNWHVVEGARRIDILVPGSQTARRSAQILRSSSAHDIALLAVDGLERPGLRLAFGDSVAKGQAIWAIGFPEAADRGRLNAGTTEATLTSGIVNRMLMQSWESEGQELRLVQHDAKVGHGNSGGPLLDTCGDVVGVNTRVSPDVLALEAYHYALGVAELRALLEQWGIRYREADSSCTAAAGGDWLLDRWLIGLAAGLGLMALVLALRGPRQRVVHVVESYSRYMKRLNLERGADATQPAPTAPVANMASLRLIRGKHILCTIRGSLDQPGDRVIGRSAALCDYLLEDNTISRRHLRVFWNPSQRQWYVEDLNSSNGTRLDGMVLAPYLPIPLRQGAQLSLGELQVIVHKEP